MKRIDKGLISGRQLRAARALVGFTQRKLADVLGVNERSVRSWESQRDKRPTGPPNDVRIEEIFRLHGVILFSDPAPGVRLVTVTKQDR
jgi:DNA-binding XRE family transcriptional regulator